MNNYLKAGSILTKYLFKIYCQLIEIVRSEDILIEILNLMYFDPMLELAPEAIIQKCDTVIVEVYLDLFRNENKHFQSYLNSLKRKSIMTMNYAWR